MKSGSTGATQAPVFQVRLLSGPRVLRLLPWLFISIAGICGTVQGSGFLERRIGSPNFMHGVSPLTPDRGILAGCGQAFESLAWLLLGLQSFGRM